MSLPLTVFDEGMSKKLGLCPDDLYAELVLDPSSATYAQKRRFGSDLHIEDFNDRSQLCGSDTKGHVRRIASPSNVLINVWEAHQEWPIPDPITGKVKKDRISYISFLNARVAGLKIKAFLNLTGLWPESGKLSASMMLEWGGVKLGSNPQKTLSSSDAVNTRRGVYGHQGPTQIFQEGSITNNFHEGSMNFATGSIQYFGYSLDKLDKLGKENDSTGMKRDDSHLAPGIDCEEDDPLRTTYRPGSPAAVESDDDDRLGLVDEDDDRLGLSDQMEKEDNDNGEDDDAYPRNLIALIQSKMVKVTIKGVEGSTVGTVGTLGTSLGSTTVEQSTTTVSGSNTTYRDDDIQEDLAVEQSTVELGSTTVAVESYHPQSPAVQFEHHCHLAAMTMPLPEAFKPKTSTTSTTTLGESTKTTVPSTMVGPPLDLYLGLKQNANTLKPTIFTTLKPKISTSTTLEPKTSTTTKAPLKSYRRTAPLGRSASWKDPSQTGRIHRKSLSWGTEEFARFNTTFPVGTLSQPARIATRDQAALWQIGTPCKKCKQLFRRGSTCSCS